MQGYLYVLDAELPEVCGESEKMAKLLSCSPQEGLKDIPHFHGAPGIKTQHSLLTWIEQQERVDDSNDSKPWENSLV